MNACCASDSSANEALDGQRHAERGLTVRDCQFPWSWMVVSNGGTVKPCCWTGTAIGSIYDGVDAVWNGDTMQSLRQHVAEGRIHPVCENAACPYVRGSKHAGADAVSSGDDADEFRKVYLFADRAYEARNPDVVAAISAGTLESAYVHYRVHGQREGRAAKFDEFALDTEFIDRFDDAWYENKYPDVRTAVSYGELSCALEHYFSHGRFERRQFRLGTAGVASHNFRTSMLEFLTGRRIIDAHPTIITFEVTTECNLKCVMCPHGRDLIENPGPLAVDVLDHAQPFIGDRDTRLQIAGIGEPLMSPLFWRIVDWSKEHLDVHIRVNSNGLLWNAANVEKILDGNLREISFSFDSATPQTYKKIRGASFERLVRNIANLVERRNASGRPNPMIYANMTLMRENIEEVEGFVILSHELKVDRARVWHLDPFGDEPDWVVHRGDWKFDYHEQMLVRYPVLSNQCVGAARVRADALGVHFSFGNDRDILFDLDPDRPPDLAATIDVDRVGARGG